MLNTTESNPVLEARGLTLAWNDGAPVVDQLSLVVHKGETVCLAGKSGTGKTTILHALAGLLTPRSGRVLLDGEDVTAKPGRVSYMLQKDLLLPNLKVIDNASLPLVLAGTPKTEARQQAQPLLERFGLASVADKWPAELSGGMRQRVAFARTYLQGNQVILLDEPFSALDAITRTDLRTWFKEMASELGISTLMITHDADEAALLADRVYVLGIPEAGAPASIVGEVVPQRDASSAQASTAVQPHNGAEQRAASVGITATAPGASDMPTSAPASSTSAPATAQMQDYSLSPAFIEAKSAILDLLQ